MPTVSPFVVKTVVLPDERVIFAPDGRIAMHKVLYRQGNIHRKTERQEIIETGEATARLLRAYAALDIDDSAFRLPLWATDPPTAARTTVERHPDRKGRILVRPTDHLEVLMTMTGVDLRFHVRTLYSAASKESKMRTLCPDAVIRTIWDKKNNKISRASRLQMAYLIRLAMLIEYCGVKESNFYTPAGESHLPAVNAKLRKTKLHSENIPEAVIDDMFAIVGDKMTIWNATATLAIERFCTAYGYVAEDMKWTEIAALWEGGPEGLEQERILGSLGRHQYFTHNVI